MTTRLRHVAVVLAGGSGSRIGAELPKQLLELAGRPIIEHTIAAFQAAPAIDEIVVVMVPGHLDAVREIVRRGDYTKVTTIVGGGDTRNASTRAALAALPGDECNVLLHDAARPLVTQSVIAAVAAALEAHAAVNTAVPSTDTVVQVHPGAPGEPDVIAAQLDRALLRRVQTPQAFRLSVIRDAYERAGDEPGAVTTDDCTVVLRHRPDVEIAVVRGDARNIKVTEPSDLVVAEQLLRD